jgi:hypothetical protein
MSLLTVMVSVPNPEVTCTSNCNGTSSPNTCSPLTPLTPLNMQLVTLGGIATDRLNSSHGSVQAYPNLLSPTDSSCSPILMENQYGTQQHDYFSVGRAWSSDSGPDSSSIPMPTGERIQFNRTPEKPTSVDDFFTLPVAWNRTVAGEHDFHFNAQKSHSQLAQDSAIQLGQPLNYFALGTDQWISVSSTLDCLAGTGSMPEQRFRCQIG